LPHGFFGNTCPACLLLAAPAEISRTSVALNTNPLDNDSSARSLPFESRRPSQRVQNFIGPYRLLELLGESSFGLVYQARQEEPILRKVAIKVIKPGMGSRDVLARFAVERRALALMKHPNIAAVLDAATTQDGQPYFVMELVNGLPITEYCDMRRLTIRERLELFITVCNAVQYAHQKGVLHRDLKPSNILVLERDGKAVAKVIGFGIAKALRKEGMVIGTPKYMSPEQAGAEPDLDTRSDVYTLGVILYQLLCGKTPLGKDAMRGVDVDEILARIRDEVPVRPSRRVVAVSDVRMRSAERMRHNLEGDLDWITMHALEKNREKRYGSAEALAADIQRHLDDEPVEAAPPSARYQFGKFARRNRLELAFAASLFFLLIVGIGASTFQAVRATRAEQQAQRLIDFFNNEILRQSGGLAQANNKIDIDPDITLHQAVQRAAQRIEVRSKGQPILEACLRIEIGGILYDLGDHVSAIEHLETAAALYKEKLGPNHPDTLSLLNNLTQFYQPGGRLKEAFALQKQKLELRKNIPEPNPSGIFTNLSKIISFCMGSSSSEDTQNIPSIRSEESIKEKIKNSRDQF
jgi:serine/threonine protein kinase